MIGALALVAGAVLLAAGSLRLSAALAPRSTAAFLLGAYVIAWAQLIVVLWALSLFGWVTRWGLLAGLGARVRRTGPRHPRVEPRRRAPAGRDRGAARGARRSRLPRARRRGRARARLCGRARARRRRRTTSTPSSTTSGAPGCGSRTGRSGTRTARARRTSTPTRRTARWAYSRRWSSGGADRYVAARPGIGVRRARDRGRGRRARSRARQAPGAPRGPVRRHPPGDRAAVLDRAERPRRRLVHRCRRRAAPRARQGRHMARGGRGGAGRGDEADRGDRHPGAGRCRARGVTLAARPAAGRRPRRAALRARTGTSSTGGRRGAGTAGSPTRRPSRASPPRSPAAFAPRSSSSSSPGRSDATAGSTSSSASCSSSRSSRALPGAEHRRAARLRGCGRGRRRRCPCCVPDLRRYLDQAYVDLWRAVGRDDLAVSPGRDITLSASNVTWYGPLGLMLLVGGIALAAIAVRRGWAPRLALLFALAPVYWIAMLAALLFYQDAAGRFLMAPMALAGATWGLVLRWRPLAWGLAGDRVTAVALAVLNDSKRPSGVALLERPAPASYWSLPRWQAQGDELHVPDLVRFVDTRVPDRRACRCRAHGERRRLPLLRPAPRPATRPARAGRTRCARRDLGVRQPVAASAALAARCADAGRPSRPSPRAGGCTDAARAPAERRRGAKRVAGIEPA